MSKGATQRVMEALGAITSGRTAPVLALELGLDRDTVRQSFRVLESRGLARRKETPARPGQRKIVRYTLTKAGRQALAGGQAITHGPKGPRPTGWDSFRARIWRALRIRNKATLHELLCLAARGGEEGAEDNARRYLQALYKAGYLCRFQDNTRSSAMETRWLLTKDTGPLPPQWNKRQHRVFDPNTQESVDVA